MGRSRAARNGANEDVGCDYEMSRKKLGMTTVVEDGPAWGDQRRRSAASDRA